MYLFKYSLIVKNDKMINKIDKKKHETYILLLNEPQMMKKSNQQHTREAYTGYEVHSASGSEYII